MVTTNGAREATPSIQSVERAANMLGFFTVSRPRLSLSELTARLGMSKATAHRYAMALRQVNLLRYDASSGEYALGPQVLVLAAAARAGLSIISAAEPLMRDLVRQVNETVVLSIWDGEAPVVVHVDDATDRVIRISVEVGSRLERFGSAQGRVFCAFLPEPAVPGLSDELTRSNKLKDELQKIRANGVGFNVSERYGVRTVATPVFSDGQIIAVMGLVSTTVSLPGSRTSPVTKALLATAARLTAVHGEHHVDPR